MGGRKVIADDGEVWIREAELYRSLLELGWITEVCNTHQEAGWISKYVLNNGSRL